MRRPVAPFDDILGESSIMKVFLESARAALDRVTDLEPSPVLIVGERGTGKKLVAGALHRCGPRRSGAFVETHAGGYPHNLMEAVFVGFERNAFPGAMRRTAGAVQNAHRGTLLLQAFDELPLPIARLVVEVIKARAVRRMKGTEAEPADVWLIATSRFPASVLRPLRPIVLTTPPLRERGDDVLLLARHYLAHFASTYGFPAKTLSANAEAALRAHDWRRLNVWALMGEMERATVFIEPEQLEPEDLTFWAARS